VWAGSFYLPGTGSGKKSFSLLSFKIKLVYTFLPVPFSLKEIPLETMTISVDEGLLQALTDYLVAEGTLMPDDMVRAVVGDRKEGTTLGAITVQVGPNLEKETV